LQKPCNQKALRVPQFSEKTLFSNASTSPKSDTVEFLVFWFGCANGSLTPDLGHERDRTI
jgi:hypothetical protein